MIFNKKFSVHTVDTVLNSDIKHYFENQKLYTLLSWAIKYPNITLVRPHIDGGESAIHLDFNESLYQTADKQLDSIIPKALIIGDDEGDELYLYVWNEKYKTGVYSIDDALGLSQLTFLSDSLSNWLK